MTDDNQNADAGDKSVRERVKDANIETGAASTETAAVPQSKNDEDVAKEVAAAGISSFDGTQQNLEENGDTTLFGNFRVTNRNIYERYQQISKLSPHVFIPLMKLGLTLTKGLDFDGENQQAIDAMKEWGDDIDFGAMANNIARCLARDGTVAVAIEENKKNINGLTILPMRYVTLLPEGHTEGVVDNRLLKGNIDRILLGERKIQKSQTAKWNEKGSARFDRDEVALFRFMSEGNFQTDILGRETYGLYGISMLESVQGRVKNLMDLVSGFAMYMRRYGIGRLHIDVKQVEDLRNQGRTEEARQLLEKIIAAQRNIKSNEDIIGAGLEVKNLGGSTVPSVEEMKKSFESDIQVGLLQSPVTMGEQKGTTYASGYIGEGERMAVLQSLQQIFINTLQTEIIDRQLRYLGYQEGEVTLRVDDLTKPVIDDQTLTDARMNLDISQEEYRDRLGFPREKPEGDQ